MCTTSSAIWLLSPPLASAAPSRGCSRTSRSLPEPKVCTCAPSKPASSSRERTASTSAGFSKRSSTEVPPVKSSAKLKPCTTIAPSAPSIRMIDSAVDTKRRRMKSNLLSWGNTLNCMAMVPSDGHGLQLAPVAVDQGGDAARHRDRGVHRGHDARDHRDREALDRPGAEREQRHAGEDRGQVGVGDRAGGLVVARGNGRLRRYPRAQFLAYALVDQHVRIHRHAHRERD